MLKLLYAVACENVIVAENGLTSLIGILERIEAQVPPDAPETAMVAKSWQCIAFWTRGTTDFPEPVSYEQRTLIVTPKGVAVFDIQVPFIVSNSHTNYRNLGTVNGFPITQSGILTIEVYLRKKGEEHWEKYSEYPIIVERNIAEVQNGNEDKLKRANNEVTIES